MVELMKKKIAALSIKSSQGCVCSWRGFKFFTFHLSNETQTPIVMRSSQPVHGGCEQMLVVY